ncbi:MAG TPA: hypothetical protein VM600_03555 [Actinomycetota bacterium]|nr:hypothetical protein [Actinomycetota bacterium]
MDGMENEPQDRPAGTSDAEISVPDIIEVLTARGLDEGQPEQVAGRWVEAGFEDPADIERLIDAGVSTPEQALAERRDDRAEPTERATDEQEPRDTPRGTTHSRSEPGDEVERDPQQPASPP